MNRFKQQTPIQFSEYTKTVWDFPPHNHNHFEIIHIKKGTGYHIINNLRFPYKENDIFLIAPEDTHYFSITTTTKFYYFKFTETLYAKNTGIQHESKWMKKIESILFHPNSIPGEIKYNEIDKQRILYILDLISQEHTNNQNYSYEIIEDSVSMILSIIARNICNINGCNDIQTYSNKDKINQILTYIRHYVYDQDKMKIESIANAHNMSKNYISIFFKKNMGESLQKYIMTYRLKLAKNRIKLSNYTISEIAYQLGYSDESYLIKQFKKRYKITPGEFRKNLPNSFLK